MQFPPVALMERPTLVFLPQQAAVQWNPAPHPHPHPHAPSPNIPNPNDYHRVVQDPNFKADQDERLSLGANHLTQPGFGNTIHHIHSIEEMREKERARDREKRHDRERDRRKDEFERDRSLDRFDRNENGGSIISRGLEAVSVAFPSLSGSGSSSLSSSGASSPYTVTITGQGREDRAGEKWMTDTPTNTVLLRGLPQQVDEKDIRAELMIFGVPIKEVRLMKNKATGTSRGFAFVEFQSVEDAQRWMELNQVSKYYCSPH